MTPYVLALGVGYMVWRWLFTHAYLAASFPLFRNLIPRHPVLILRNVKFATDLFVPLEPF